MPDGPPAELTTETFPSIGDVGAHGAPPPPSDPLASLARSAGAGEADSAQQLVRAVAPTVYRVVRALLGAGHPDLDDQVQDALIGFMGAVPAFRGECTVTQFASRIAARRTLAAKRRARVVRNWLGFHVRTEQVLQPPSEIPSDAVVSTRRKHLVRTLLTALPEPQAEAVALHLVLGHSIEEVAQITSTPLNTIKSRLRLAKDAMRARLNADPRLNALAERDEDSP